MTAERFTDLVQSYGIPALSAILILWVGNWVARKFSKILGRVLNRRENFDPMIASFVSSISYYILLVMVVLAALSKVGVNTTSFLAVLGTAGLAVGLAFKDSLSHLAAGIMVLIARPFKAGDFVTVGGESGTVTSISFFSTVLLTGDNKKVMIPNSAVISGTITNFSTNPTRRIDLEIGVSYKDDLKLAKDTLQNILTADSRILLDPAPVVAVSSLGESAVVLMVRPWVATGDYATVRQDLLESIKIELERVGISIPTPQRTITIVHGEESTSL